MSSQYQTERLIIRPTNAEDINFIFNLFNSPKWIENIGDRNITSTTHAKQYIETVMLKQLKKLGYSSYTVIRQSDNQKIGTVGLYDREGVDGIDFGFAFLPQFEGKGYAFESASKIKEAAINEFRIQNLVAITRPSNTGSQKLLNKLGFSFKKDIILPKHEFKEWLLYAIN
ncbi:GNAT family N-acetyltransferase [Tenacibaculum singaporense]|uniref:N-acetyltransferase n=1 Tax=Tenacibaculum singaporense TaxID=2358479 RepID=A0A3S8R7F2_9FLAO|nr:GNAT family N-acetyltransferase [Tenacibaculum singaporense]AZJ35667.1 N-acetyltransferase [Tenacibaculum singaporense]